MSEIIRLERARFEEIAVVLKMVLGRCQTFYFDYKVAAHVRPGQKLTIDWNGFSYHGTVENVFPVRIDRQDEDPPPPKGVA